MININIPDDCFKVTISTANADSTVHIAFAMPGGIVDTLETRVNLEPAAIRSQFETLLKEAGFKVIYTDTSHSHFSATYERAMLTEGPPPVSLETALQRVDVYGPEAVANWFGIDLLVPLRELLLPYDRSKKVYAYLVGCVGGRMAYDLLCEALETAHDDPAECDELFRAMAQTGDPRALDRFAGYISQAQSPLADPHRRCLIENALPAVAHLPDSSVLEAQLKKLATTPDIFISRSAVMKALTRLDLAAVMAIAANEKLATEIRCDALQALRNMNAPGVVELLIAIMTGDQPVEVRAAATEALSGHEDERVVPALIETLKVPHYALRTEVIATLGQHADPRAIKPLANLFGDHSFADTGSYKSRTISEQARDALNRIHTLDARKAIDYWTTHVKPLLPHLGEVKKI